MKLADLNPLFQKQSLLHCYHRLQQPKGCIFFFACSSQAPKLPHCPRLSPDVLSVHRLVLAIRESLTLSSSSALSFSSRSNSYFSSINAFSYLCCSISPFSLASLTAKASSIRVKSSGRDAVLSAKNSSETLRLSAASASSQSLELLRFPINILRLGNPKRNRAEDVSETE
ncbi:hypothetical protein ACFX2J_014671 [Malus domestica]